MPRSSYHRDTDDQSLWVERCSLESIAQKFDTPCYVYSKADILGAFSSFDNAFSKHEHITCVSVKACSNLTILSLLAERGAGFDVVSGGELERVLLAGGDPKKVVFAGVGKSDLELTRGLEIGIALFNVESIEELEHLNQLAGNLGKVAPVALRVNPDVDGKTHRHINTGKEEHKFGVPLDRALEAYRLWEKYSNLNFVGIDCHIGSLITDLSVFQEAFERLKQIVLQIRDAGVALRYVDIGGGLGVSYTGEDGPSVEEYAKVVTQTVGTLGLTILSEPGRFIFANSSVLLSRVVFQKQSREKKFLVLDAGFNDLIRPVLYEAHHDIEPVKLQSARPEPFDVVGPVCETGDCFAHDRLLPPLERGELVAIRSAGAYGFVMASNYNTRPRPPEVLVDNSKVQLIRPRESLQEMLGPELECLPLQTKAIKPFS